MAPIRVFEARIEQVCLVARVVFEYRVWLMCKASCLLVVVVREISSNLKFSYHVSLLNRVFPFLLPSKFYPRIQTKPCLKSFQLPRLLIILELSFTHLLQIFSILKRMVFQLVGIEVG